LIPRDTAGQARRWVEFGWTSTLKSFEVPEDASWSLRQTRRCRASHDTGWTDRPYIQGCL